jgi:hypothetical protein
MQTPRAAASKPAQTDSSVSKVSEDLSNNNGTLAESGSDSGGNKSDEKRTIRQPHPTTTPKSGVLPTRPSFSSLVPAKSRTGNELATKNMTVETETVTSIPQSAIGTQSERSAPGRPDGNGSIRLKPSNETIRPKKDRKRAVRRPQSINSGTGKSLQVSIRNPYHHHLFPLVREDLRARCQSALSESYESIETTSSRHSGSSYSSPVAYHPFHMSSQYYYTQANHNYREASSKADIFEQKVASAVDEANSSDSDENFVYESNPPDNPRRHHSRTPSATSMTSLADARSNIRSIGNVLENHRQATNKRSMKFANSTYNPSSPVAEGQDQHEGTIRHGNHRTGGGGTIHHHHHHIGRFGRGGAHPPSLFDADSPFPQSAKSRVSSSRQSSRPNSPRFANFPSRTGNGSAKTNGELSMYDLDGEGADDERTPLIQSGTVRTPRSRTSRRFNQARQPLYDPYTDRSHRADCCRGFLVSIAIFGMISLLASGAILFLFTTTKPLYGVGVREIQNVLASEQELMLDLLVEAVNPNLIPVQITDMDVNVFAKSKHVGTDKWWREHPHGAFSSWRSPHKDHIDEASRSKARNVTNPARPLGGVDKGTDPIDPDDPSGDSQTMLLGRIFHFDSALVFEASPWKQDARYSVGEVRLSKPGNKTEAGGTERWERVMQYPFELIVRGVLKYELPLNSHMHTAPIGASILVKPSKGVDDGEQTGDGKVPGGEGGGNGSEGQKDHWW